MLPAEEAVGATSGGGLERESEGESCNSPEMELGAVTV
jgi:hypothetical protein